MGGVAEGPIQRGRCQCCCVRGRRGATHSKAMRQWGNGVLLPILSTIVVSGVLLLTRDDDDDVSLVLTAARVSSLVSSI